MKIMKVEKKGAVRVITYLDDNSVPHELKVPRDCWLTLLATLH